MRTNKTQSIKNGHALTNHKLNLKDLTSSLQKIYNRFFKGDIEIKLETRGKNCLVLTEEGKFIIDAIDEYEMVFKAAQKQLEKTNMEIEMGRSLKIENGFACFVPYSVSENVESGATPKKTTGTTEYAARKFYDPYDTESLDDWDDKVIINR